MGKKVLINCPVKSTSTEDSSVILSKKLVCHTVTVHLLHPICAIAEARKISLGTIKKLITILCMTSKSIVWTQFMARSRKKKFKRTKREPLLGTMVARNSSVNINLSRARRRGSDVFGHSLNSARGLIRPSSSGMTRIHCER